MMVGSGTTPRVIYPSLPSNGGQTNVVSGASSVYLAGPEMSETWMGSGQDRSWWFLV